MLIISFFEPGEVLARDGIRDVSRRMLFDGEA
jgi:hypothetical protein